MGIISILSYTRESGEDRDTIHLTRCIQAAPGGVAGHRRTTPWNNSLNSLAH